MFVICIISYASISEIKWPWISVLIYELGWVRNTGYVSLGMFVSYEVMFVSCDITSIPAHPNMSVQIEAFSESSKSRLFLFANNILTVTISAL